MTNIERQEHRVRLAEDWLAYMIDSNDDLLSLSKELALKSADCMLWYKEDKAENHLKTAEMYALMAENLKQSRFTIGEIRKQRERVQWEKKILSQMKKQHIEPSQS